MSSLKSTLHGLETTKLRETREISSGQGLLVCRGEEREIRMKRRLSSFTTQPIVVVFCLTEIL
ncbi:hypothetical protein C0J52_00589 [Blattella germanica]|nr:hypothetical protein C0J52_00589 [Blattella germanica]